MQHDVNSNDCRQELWMRTNLHQELWKQKCLLVYVWFMVVPTCTDPRAPSPGTGWECPCQQRVMNACGRLWVGDAVECTVLTNQRWHTAVKTPPVPLLLDWDYCSVQQGPPKVVMTFPWIWLSFRAVDADKSVSRALRAEILVRFISPKSCCTCTRLPDMLLRMQWLCTMCESS